MEDAIARGESFESPNEEASPSANYEGEQEKPIGSRETKETLATVVEVAKIVSPEGQCSPSGVGLALVLAGGALAIGAYYLRKAFSRSKASKADRVAIENLILESLHLDRPSVPLSPVTPTLPNKKLGVSDR